MKKIYIYIMILFTTLSLTSCKKIQIVNEVINRVVNYEENISILDFEDAIVEAASIGRKSVIGIKVKAGMFHNETFGSGILIKKEKQSASNYRYYVLTNRHVVSPTANNLSITIYLGNEDIYDAKLETYDENIDVAIISFTTPRDLEIAKVSSDKVEVGRFVIAVGNPYEIENYYNTVTVGNISHTERYLEEKNTKGELIKNKYIQHNAEINSGNSGGGLFNIKGELIGINTWKIAEEDVEGMSFAIAITEVYEKYQIYFE